MSKTTLGIFAAAIVLLLIAVVAKMPIAAGGGGVLVMAGLIYAYVVAKRDEERAAHAPRDTVEAAE